MLIPVMIPPYDDEWFNSWVKRLADANGMDIKKFYTLFLHISEQTDEKFYNPDPKFIRFPIKQYPKGLMWLSKKYEFFPDPWKLFFKNLNLAAEAVNERPEVTAKIVQDILFHGSDPSKNVNANYPKKKLVYCPVCARMDLEKGIKPYLRTWHYVGSPVVCAVHKCKLKELACLSDEITDLTVSYVDPNGKDMDDAKMAYQNYQAMADTADDDLEDEEKPCYYDRSLTYLREKSAFVKCRCKKCGLEFWNTKYAIEVGRSCPRCEENVLEHQLMLVGGGEYWFIRKVDDIGTKECIIHQVCGRVIGLSATRVIWNGQRCRCLQRDLMRARGCEHFKKMLKEIHGNEFEHIRRYENSRRQAYIRHSKCNKTFQMFPTRKNVKNLKCPYCTPSKSKPKSLPGICIPVEK